MVSSLTWKIIRILLGIAVLGYIISQPGLLLWLGSEPFWVPFLLWYAIFFIFILWIGFTVSKRFTLRHAVGFLVLYFALAPVLGWSDNPFLSQQLTGATITGVESGPEESILTYFWLLFTQDIGLLIILVYIVSPILLMLLALYILGPKRFTNAFYRLISP
jgi:hypothetical protein